MSIIHTSPLPEVEIPEVSNGGLLADIVIQARKPAELHSPSGAPVVGAEAQDG